VAITDEVEYLSLLENVRCNGQEKEDRTGVGTLSQFGAQLCFDLQDGFPAVTTKKLFFRGVKEELLWFLCGDTNARSLQGKGVHIWDEWADEDGELGPIYGRQWRDWCGIDQIQQVLNSLADDPDSRRHLVSAWNVPQLDRMALAPCHVLFQFYVGDGALSCQVYQRSGDLFLGVPFNIASYALLTNMVAHVLGYREGDLLLVLGDAHIYRNHLTAVDEQLGREPYEFPGLWLNPDVTDLFAFDSDDIDLVGYEHHPKITAPVAV
jgi:thymidylate synthase